MSINLGWRTAGWRTARWRTAGRRTAKRRTAGWRTIASRIVASRTGGQRLALVIASLCLASGCTKRNPDLCCETDAECTTIGFSSHAPCDLGVCVHNECTTTTGTCDGDEDCGGATPACVAGTCSVCATSATCPAISPVCDMTSHDCRTCAADSECDSGACDLAAGTCVDQAEILYASPVGTAADLCTSTMPCSLRHAAELANPARSYIVLRPGRHTSGATFSAQQATIAGNNAIIDATDTFSSSIEILAGSTITMRDLTIDEHSPNPDPDTSSVIDVQQSTLIVENMLSNTEHIYAIDADVLTINHSNLTGYTLRTSKRLVADSCLFHTRGPATTGSVELTNSIIISDAALPALSMASHDPLHSSSITNNSFIGGSIICYSDDANAVRLLDSNILYNMSSIQHPIQCAYQNNLVMPEADIGDATHVTGDPHFVDMSHDNFHLSAGSPAIDAADPTLPSNGHDFDGTLRPQGLRADIGAFEYVP
jgi:hypothetical protein